MMILLVYLQNNPPFPGQMFALNNFAGVSRKQPESTFAGVLELDPYSRGMGGMGIPGDLSKPVKICKRLHLRKTKMQYPGDGEKRKCQPVFHILGHLLISSGMLVR